jgi:ParB-like chromosome segregation protein Spo0J
MNSEIKMVRLSDIHPNPWRNLKRYAFDDKKLEILRRSYRDDIGLWESIIARKAKGSGYEQAFGHYRKKAAEQEFGKDARIPVIVRDDLTDKKMVQFMGRENLEDFNSDFMKMLESWEGATQFLEADRPQKPEDLEIAMLLGWIVPQSGDRSKEQRMDHTARTCGKASRLVKGGYLNLADLKGLATSSVRELVDRLVSQQEMVEKMAVKTGRPAGEVERVKKSIGRAGQYVAKQVREGKVSHRNISGEVTAESFRAVGAKKPTPLFKAFASSLITQIGKVAKDDVLADRFHEIRKVLSSLEMQDDIDTVQYVAMACGHAADRFTKWQTTFSDPKKKVVPLKLKGISHG